MCLACEMDAWWFAATEAHARTAAAEAGAQAQRPSGEDRSVGEGGVEGWRDARGESADPLPNPPSEEGGGGTAPPRFACEETQGE